MTSDIIKILAGEFQNTTADMWEMNHSSMRLSKWTRKHCINHWGYPRVFRIDSKRETVPRFEAYHRLRDGRQWEFCGWLVFRGVSSPIHGARQAVSSVDDATKVVLIVKELQ